RGDQAEVVEDHWPELEDEPAELLQRLVDHLPERGQLTARLLGIDVEEALADLRLEDDIRHRLRRAVMDLPGDAFALLFLRIDDRLNQQAIVDDRPGFRRNVPCG